jgi:hypothetical protein
MIKLAAVKMVVLTLVGAAVMAGPAFSEDYDDEDQGVILAPSQHSPSSNYLSYPYNPAADASRGHAMAPPPLPANVPAPVPEQTSNVPAPEQKDISLATRSGIDLGLQASHYHYTAPSTATDLIGPKFGVTASMTGKFAGQWFVTGDFRGAFGFSDYTGNGTRNGNFEDLWDIRGLIGRDFFLSRFSLSPYTGIGFRDLYTDMRGTSSTGTQLYRRENQLLYIPIGVEPRFRVTPDARVAANAEFDYVANGKELANTSDLSGSLGANLPNLTENQKSGYGVRGSVMWETNRWAAGPFFNYWKIGTSSFNCVTDPTGANTVCAQEPSNHTLEGGVQFRYHIY